MDKPTLYILCGLPFSGKSAITRELVNRFGFSSVVLDQINIERGVGLEIGKKPLTPREWDVTYKESYKRTEMFLSEGKSVVYDATNFTKEQRDKLRTIADANGFFTKVIYIDIPESEVRNRWLHNKNAKNRFDVREEDFAHVADNFQPPTPDENVIIYDPRTNLDEWIKKYFNHMQES